MRPIIIGIFAAFFFAFTFVLNRSMELSGGSWIWSASLRYIFMIPFLFVLVLGRRNLKPLLIEMKRNPGKWFLWSFVGFGMFYAPLCFSAAYGPGWLIAGTWQVTIISGSLLAPLFFETKQTDKGPIKVRGKIPLMGLAMSLIILLGVGLMQLEQANVLSIKTLMLGVLPVLLASFAYPLGNRKMMEICENRFDAYQRVLGMTIASLPFWLLLAIYGVATVGLPSTGQMVQSLFIALFSGVIATVLFFRATDLVKGNMQKLAAVEATQSFEVLFAVLGELLILSAPAPSYVSWIGILLVIAGMVLHSYVSNKEKGEWKRSRYSAKSDRYI
ncbi:multidrug resistance efflux transporter family protein [Bacillus sp. FJAT-49705]|uniref:Multidrug resistance efflux transporter family protein n=1 Tax=Cytobacillus citreus TaxID=2833586 RepID=A0ABS5NQH2_9BACI|nr:multidrug resistance efflux transporter family protein [Cytobacillus citreus]MBS4190072.1 multidrug resistance efflux transporter family protein [Cytobacillus citreus]